MLHKSYFIIIIGKCWYLLAINYFLNVTSHFVMGFELINY
jgi:hypothetical protein